MSNQIKQFHIETVQSNGAYLKLQQSHSNGFPGEAFQELQMKMIQSNVIPRLVPISFEDVNGKKSVYYRIEGLRMLRAIAKERPLTMQDYYTLFLNIIQALQDSSNHMLTEENYVLHEDYIYIGDNYHQVYLMYLPFKEIEETNSMYDQLKKLLLHIAGDVQGIHGGQFKMILNYVKDPGFSLQGLKHLLQDLQGYEPNEVKDNNVRVESKTEVQIEEETIIKQVKKLPPLSGKERLYSILFGILLIAVSWKLAEGGSKLMFLIASISSLVAITGVIVYWFVWRPGVEPIITEKEVKINRPKKKQKVVNENSHRSTHQHAISYSQNQNGINQDFGQSEDEKEIHAIINQMKQEQFNKHASENPQQGSNQHAINDDDVLNDVQQHINSENKYEDNQNLSSEESHMDYFRENHINDIRQPMSNAYPDETVLLETELLGEPTPTVKNILITERNGKEEEISLEGETVIIGRAEKGTNIINKDRSISRLHIELTRLSDTYGLKDLGSKNGTFINNQRVNPHEIYELKDGDQIQIGKTYYTYKVYKAKVEVL
ncbi:DUF6382 domain-containing protein [Virgibacillus soli]|uniref:DUF6382 domain-containing protein n=1 Tax=Paracerasibacillus soli TaxID=480284 RepID=A0ABU5CSX4_9BACI|nr:DUF6382 domain-containing protein [Virgibacillus soli]MDY0408518.1 DUF6382 domain-containing protein [Virgibacillus soli]